MSAGLSGGFETAGVPALGALRTRLARVEGLDFLRAMHAAGGSVTLLVRLLRSFAKHYADGLPELLAAPSAQRSTQWRRAAHSLRGACGAIAAVSLAERLETFECDLARGADEARLAEQAAMLHAELLRLTAQLRASVP